MMSCWVAVRRHWRVTWGDWKARAWSESLAWIWRPAIVLVKKHFPQARILADRFHVIRTVNHHFLACWKDIDPIGVKNRGLVSPPAPASVSPHGPAAAAGVGVSPRKTRARAIYYFK